MTVEFPDGEMGLSLCLGAVTESSVRVWLRDPEFKTHTATLCLGDKKVGSAELICDPERDGIAAADVQSSIASPGATFEVRAAGLSRTARFAPAPGEPADFAFGFGSCHQPFEPAPGGGLRKNVNDGIYQYALKTFTDADVSFNMFIGDQVYSDEVSAIPPKELEESDSPSVEQRPVALLSYYRSLYRGYFNESGFRQFFERFPSYMMWDDHDIVDDWGSFNVEEEYDDVLFGAAKAAFIEYQASHNPGKALDAKAPFCFESWHGDTGFFVLDLRSERDYLRERLISEAQWSQLAAFLDSARERDVPTIFIGSTIPVIHFSPAAVRVFDKFPAWMYGADVRDRWDATPFHKHRNRLLEMLFDWQRERGGRQVFLLSGDVHVGSAFEIRRRRGDGLLYQLTSSAFTSPGSLLHKAVNKVGTRFANVGEDICRSTRLGIATSNNFGLVRVKASESVAGHDVTFELHSYDRGPEEMVRFSMSPGRAPAVTRHSA